MSDTEIEKIAPDQLVALVSLQRLDAEKDALAKRRDQKPGEVNAREREEAAQKAACDDVKSLMTSTQKMIDKKNLEAEATEAEITKLDGQLFSLKSNDDFNRMKSQIQSRKNELSDHQDKALELMMSLDDLAQRHADELARLAQLSDVVKRAKEKLSADTARLEAEIAAKDELAKKEREVLPAPLLEIYDDLVERGKTAVAPLRIDDTTCLGCMTQVTTSIMSRCVGGHFTTCNQCQAILYVARHLEA